MRFSKAVIIIPTYNEAENLRSLLSRLREVAPDTDVLVVDDNSPDGTGDIASELCRTDERLYVLHRVKKEGLAGAYLAGFEWGMKKDYEFFLQMDADHSHSPTDVPRLLTLLEKQDVASGSRYIKGGAVSGWPIWRKWVSRGGNIYARWMLGMPNRDVTSGFNGWRRKVLENLDLTTLQSRGYGYQLEMKYRAYRRGYRLGEVAIHFADRQKGYSKMSGQIVWEAAIQVAKMRWNSTKTFLTSLESRPLTN